MEQTLAGKVALITGAGGDQGRLAARRFAAAGAIVAGCDINAEKNRETKRIVTEEGGRFLGSEPVDLGDHVAAQKWVEGVAAETGRIDIVYNNASAARFVPFESFSFEDWEWTVRNELHLVFSVTRAAWPWLARQGGVVLNIASVAGIAGSGPGGAAHAATKGAVIALTKQLAAEGAPVGIRVVAISPGLIATAPVQPLLTDPGTRAALIERNMIKRPGEPADIVGLALFLVSDEAGYITGANVVVDGGRVAW